MNRAILQRLVQARLDDADCLLKANRWPAAYYLAGYSIECAHKSCVLRHVDETGIIFSDRDYLKRLGDCWTHDFRKLVDLAGLTASWEEKMKQHPAFRGHWNVAQEWTEASRYNDGTTKQQAGEILTAITDPIDGIMTWLQQTW